MNTKVPEGHDEEEPSNCSTNLYHVTNVANLHSIFQQGILPAETTHRDGLETDLLHIAADQGIDFPVTRQNCVFLYPSQHIALMGIHPDTEYHNNLIPHSGIALVDAASIDTNLYIGEFRLISDAIDFQFMEKPDKAMISQSFEDALSRYAKSFTKIEKISQVEKISEKFYIPEVVIEGGVKPSAITECIFWKQLHTQGLPRPVQASDGDKLKNHSRRLSIVARCRNRTNR